MLPSLSPLAEEKLGASLMQWKEREMQPHDSWKQTTRSKCIFGFCSFIHFYVKIINQSDSLSYSLSSLLHFASWRLSWRAGWRDYDRRLSVCLSRLCERRRFRCVLRQLVCFYFILFLNTWQLFTVNDRNVRVLPLWCNRRESGSWRRAHLQRKPRRRGTAEPSRQTGVLVKPFPFIPVHPKHQHTL